ncbi:MAG: aldo/keto reductase [Candidatus Omnitrophica bacterium]|nr:aldo/keto reductase [Candidatus Omnitrophota bacterium]
MNLLSKISLGTVQFGLDYGIANGRGKVDKAEVFKIIELANSKKVEFLDTAHSYGESEKVLGQVIEKESLSFKIVSKMPAIGNNFSGQVEKVFLESLSDLKMDSLYGYLIHKFEDYLLNKGLWEQMKGLKDKRMVKKIGFSLYNPEELETLLSNGVRFDIIQMPYSIFDRRFAGYFKTLKSKGVEIHVRSVFLQGLAFLDPQNLHGNLDKAKECLLLLRSIAAENDVSINSICLNFALLNPFVDKVVIGIDGIGHLKDNLRDISLAEKINSMIDKLDSLSIDDEDVILPYKWTGAKR